MVGKVVIAFFALALFSIGTVFGQQVEIPREKPAAIVQIAKPPAAQPQIELHPQGQVQPRPQIQQVSYTPTKMPSSSTTTTLSVEQMRQAGALAGQRLREELHDIEEDEPPAKPAPPPKKQPAPNAVRV